MSLKKTGAPIDESKQTFYIDEHTLEYNPKTMAEGTHQKEIEEHPQFKHVLLRKKKLNDQLSFDNYQSKSQFTWQNEL